MTRADGRETTLELGDVSRTVTKTEEPPPTPPFGPPPPPPKTTTEEYRFAKLAGSDLVFEVRADRLDAAFAAPADLRDDRLARFDPASVRDLTITRPGEPPITLAKKSGDESAPDAKDKADRWYVGDVLAEPAKVNELVDALSGLTADAANRTDAPTPAELAEAGLGPDAGTTVAVTVAPEDGTRRDRGEAAYDHLPGRQGRRRGEATRRPGRRLAAAEPGRRRGGTADRPPGPGLPRPPTVRHGRRPTRPPSP